MQTQNQKIINQTKIRYIRVTMGPKLLGLPFIFIIEPQQINGMVIENMQVGAHALSRL